MTVPAQPFWAPLDGLRGLAVLAVVVFHLAAGWAVNGYVGVDVFFALSGFLITALLLGERARTGRIALPQFYARRLLRLYPALLVTVLGVLLLGVLAGQPGRVVPGAVAALAYAANWWIYTGHEAVLLDHTWTLAIEEHFYLLWPVLVLLLTERRLRALGLGVAAVLAVVVLTPWPDAVEGVRGSYLRGAPIVWGSALAALVHGRQPGPRVQALAAWAGLGALLLLGVILVVPWPLPLVWLTGVRSVPGLLSVLVIAAAVLHPPAPAARALCWGPLRWVGRRAYGVYLYHLPVVMVLGFQVDALPGWARAPLACGVTLALAALSYQWIERPFLLLKRRFRPAVAR